MLFPPGERAFYKNPSAERWLKPSACITYTSWRKVHSKSDTLVGEYGLNENQNNIIEGSRETIEKT